MPLPDSPALAATLHALHGESDGPIVAPALDEREFARVLALAPGVDPVIGALGALAGGLPDVIPPAVRDSPALHAAIASLIGTRVGWYVLDLWAEIAPAGWGASHAAALIDAAQRDRCPRWAAATLIGPCDASAALPSHAYDIAHTVRRWGQATPDHPTAWMDALAPAERDRLLGDLRANHDTAAICLPWLPEADAADIVHRIGREYLSLALAAYAAASPVAHARHAAVLSALIHRARQDDLIALTRLAVASGMDAAWDEVVRLLRANPWSVIFVVEAAPWNNMRADVQETILSAAQQNDECAAIAFARGMHDQPLRITRDLACAFFAVVTPEVWTSLSPDERYAWRSRLDRMNSYLAVRSLGLDPAFLACADLDDDVIAAVRRHAPNETSLHWTLLSVAARDLPPDAVPAVVAALPNPPDPVAFVQIAGGIREMPSALRDWIATHPTPQAHGAAVTVLHAAAQRVVSIRHRRALAHALAGWSWEETNALLAALPDKFVTALHPHPDILTRQNSFRQALDAFTALPPSAALPAFHALDALAAAQHGKDQRDVGEEVARVLRDHGGIFAVIVGMLRDDVRAAIVPPPDAPSVESAINALAIINPLVAHYLAYALRDADAAVALDALTESAPDTLTRIWDLLPETLQQSVLGDRDALLHDVAGPDGADMLAQTLRDRNADDRRSWLALRMLRDADAERRMRGAAILAQRPDVATALLPLLNDDLRTALESVPAIAFANADLPSPYPTAPASIRRRRR
jgi:hypothetical protein